MADVIMHKHPHCWHNREMYSEKRTVHEVCCNCGETREVPVYFGTPKKHGPYAPGPITTNGVIEK